MESEYPKRAESGGEKKGKGIKQEKTNTTPMWQVK
jgi:hypothetical protein